MKARPDTDAVPPASPGAHVLTASPDGLRIRIRSVLSVFRQVLGLPDYERYLAHAAERHPDLPVLSRAAFCERELKRKYGEGGARCC